MKFQLKKTINNYSPVLNTKWNYVVNFNYTDVISRQYGFPCENIFYIHGDLYSEPNNMILGIRDDEKLGMEFIEFKKYFQRLWKRTGSIDETRFNKETISDGLNIQYSKIRTTIFGHSLSNTDGDVLRKVEQLSDEIQIYYIDREDYRNKLINIIDVFGKDYSLKLTAPGGKIKFSFLK